MIKNGRELAWLTLNRIETEQAYASLALQAVLAENAGADQREKAFCTELVYGTLRWLLKLDFMLGRLLNRPLNSLPPAVKNVLRLALYQIVFLTAIPERAVCHSTVELVKRSRFRGLAGLVNGVLRNFLRNQAGYELPDRRQDLAAYLEVAYSHPRWLVERWLQRFGAAQTETILQVNNQRPPLTVRLKQPATFGETTLATLRQEGFKFNSGKWLPEALNLTELPRALEASTAFRRGWLTPQDESSMLVAHLLNPLPDELIIDLCAAPGGKSTHLAELMHDRGRIISLDDHPHKVNLIKENACRLNLTAVEAVVGDARHFRLPENQQADAVLVDAPCSGTGVLRRRVDARYRRRPQDLVQLADLQREILDQAATLVKPQGRLVYSTCTLEPEENQKQIEWFLRNHPEFELADYRAYLPGRLPNYLEVPDQRWITLIPVPDGGDGFFICRFNRLK